MHNMDASVSTALKSTFKEEINNSSESHFLHRLHCVLLVSKGCCCQQVAEWFGMHQRTVERWVHYFKEYGVEGLKDEQKTGRPTKVRDDQLKQLQCDMLFKPSEFRYNKDKWSGKLLKTHLKQRYDIEMSVRQCQRLLLQLRDNTASHVA
ncbi:helix-turn-helix domain-containing protein [Pseudomonadota bacterium]